MSATDPRRRLLDGVAISSGMDADPYQSEFTVPGDPVPQSRPRVTRRGGVYYADRIVRYRHHVQVAARAAGVPLREGPLWLGVECIFERPKSHRRKSGLKPDAPEFPYAKGDCTNIAKGIEDALNGIGWLDDSQVVELAVRKRWAKPGEDPAAIVTICNVEPLPDVIEKRRNAVNRSWTVGEREERRVYKPQSMQERRMIQFSDIVEDWPDEQ